MLIYELYFNDRVAVTEKDLSPTHSLSKYPQRDRPVPRPEPGTPLRYLVPYGVGPETQVPNLGPSSAASHLH